MRIAILHSSITEGNNGSEKLVYEMAKKWGSKIYICDYREEMERSYPGIGDMVKVDRIDHPSSFSRREFEIRTTMMNRKDVDADFIMYSTPMPCHRIKKDSTPYLYYCHTPDRGFFDLKDQLLGQMKEWGFPRYQIARIIYERRRNLDMDLFKNHVNPKQVVTNSELIMDRYESAYGKRPRRAVGAPVDTEKFDNKPSEDFYFTSGGLRPNKRIDWQIRAFEGTKEHLKIAGDGPERRKLENLAKDVDANVEFLGRVSDEELLDLYSRCKAFIFAARNEDFGMVPVEAMASGKPVISINEGGPMEYLDKSVAFFFDNIKGLRDIINNLSIDVTERMKEACIERSRMFDTDTVSHRLLGEMKAVLNEFY